MLHDIGGVFHEIGLLQGKIGWVRPQRESAISVVGFGAVDAMPDHHREGGDGCPSLAVSVPLKSFMSEALDTAEAWRVRFVNRALSGADLSAFAQMQVAKLAALPTFWRPAD